MRQPSCRILDELYRSTVKFVGLVVRGASFRERSLSPSFVRGSDDRSFYISFQACLPEARYKTVRPLVTEYAMLDKCYPPHGQYHIFAIIALAF